MESNQVDLYNPLSSVSKLKDNELRELYNMLLKEESFCYILDSLTTNDGWDLDNQLDLDALVMQLINGSIGNVNKVIHALKNTTLSYVKNSYEETHEIYDKYIEKTNTMINLIKLMYSIKSSDNLDDKIVYYNICAILGILIFQ